MTENTKQDVPISNQLEVFTEPIKYVTTGVVIDSHAIKVSRPFLRFSDTVPTISNAAISELNNRI